jgi:DNA-binding NarL/FixJ family response regulator
MVLTPAEKKVVSLVAEGWEDSYVADLLGVCEETVQYHLVNIYAKLEDLIPERVNRRVWLAVQFVTMVKNK